MLAAEKLVQLDLIPLLNYKNSKKMPIVFIHGWGADSQVWQSLIDELQKQGLTDRSFFGLDLPGFGIHENVCAETLEKFILLAEGALPERCILVGWSLGGMVAAQITARKKVNVKALVCIATNLSYVQTETWQPAMPQNTFDDFYHGIEKTPALTLKRFYGLQVMGDANRKLVVSCFSDMNANRSDSVLSEAVGEIASSWVSALDYLKALDNTSDILRIEPPIMHIFGNKDMLVPVQAANEILNLTPDSQVEVLQGVGHVPHVSQPELVARKIIGLLKEYKELAPKKEKKKIADSFSKAAKTYDKAALLQKRVADKLLHLVPEVDGTIVDLGCGTGYCTQHIQKQGRNVIGIDIAEGMLQQVNKKTDASWVAADIEALPIAVESINGFISSLSIQWCDSLARVFSQVYAALAPGGYFLFSTLGPVTLNELSKAWEIADSGKNSHVHVNEFEPSEVVENSFLDAQFSIEIFLREEQVIEYDQVMELMRELKSIGAHNVNEGRNPGLTGKGRIVALANAYESFRNSAGKIPATYEVYYYLLRK